MVTTKTQKPMHIDEIVDMKPASISDEAMCLSMRGLQDIAKKPHRVMEIAGPGVDTVTDGFVQPKARKMVLCAIKSWVSGRIHERFAWADKATGVLFGMDGHCLSSLTLRMG